MLRLQNLHPDPWRERLPAWLFDLGEELTRVDQLLDDERFFAPFRPHFHSGLGRPSTPIEVYLRLMYLKHSRKLGYETLVREVSDSLRWRAFCHLRLEDQVPDPTTLCKLSRRLGEAVLKELNELLMTAAAERKVLRCRKLRVDTTVVEANIHYPTDASLLVDAARALTQTMKRVQALGAATRLVIRNRQRSLKRRLRRITQALSRRAAHSREQVKPLIQELAGITRRVVSGAQRVRRSLHGTLAHCSGQARYSLQRLGQQLGSQVALTGKLLAQTAAVLQGQRRLPQRVVSFHEPEARPIRRGKLRPPTEFGWKLRLSESEERLILEYAVFVGNPEDHGLLQPAVQKVCEQARHPPWGVATDRQFSSRENEAALRQLGVERIGLPQRGKKSRERERWERQRWFRRLWRWRAGQEATISRLKGRYGLARSLYRGTRGCQLWVGWGVVSYNLDRLARLLQGRRLMATPA